MKYTRPRAAIATGLCLLMAAGPVAPAAFAVDGDSAGQQRYERADVKVNTVLFDANGGSFSGGATLADIATQADGTVVFPENPTREGYEFAGWTYDSAGNDPFVAGTKLDKHVNLYAQWTKQAEAATTVLFDANGGLFSTGLDLADIATQADGTVVFPENPTREGYEFAGWTYDRAGNDPFVDGTKLDKHVNLYAQWTKQAEAATTVLFDANGGLFSTGLDLADIATQADGTVVFPENPTREGYEFAGWTYDRAGNDPFVDGTKLDKHVNLYAKWTKVQEASVLFYANGGLFPTGGDMMDVLPQSDGTIVLAPEPTREGYEFTGWAYDAAGVMPLDPSIKIDKHTTLFAQWKQVEAEVFAADFDANGGEFAGGIASMNVAAREDGTLPVPLAPTREGYEFAGWYYDAEGTQAFDFATKLEQDVKLYAKWTKVQEASVLFYANGGLFPTGGDMMDVLPQSDGTIVLAPEPTREGYEFTGWAYDAAGVMPLDPSIKIDKHTTLFAQWKQVEAEVFAADFDANGGEFAGGIASMNVAAREDGTLPVPLAPTREGYEFAGWYYDAEGTQAFDFATKLEQDVKLYAKWIEQTPAVDTHKVTFSDGIDATEDAVVEVEDGKAVARPGDPELAGYKFLGWTLDKETMELYDFSTPVTADITLHGVWQKVAAETPGADENQAQGENGKAENVNAESAKAELTTLPQTSDNSMMLVGVAAAAGVAALGAGAYALRRRNEQR